MFLQPSQAPPGLVGHTGIYHHCYVALFEVWVDLNDQMIVELAELCRVYWRCLLPDFGNP